MLLYINSTVSSSHQEFLSQLLAFLALMQVRMEQTNTHIVLMYESCTAPIVNALASSVSSDSRTMYLIQLSDEIAVQRFWFKDLKYRTQSTMVLGLLEDTKPYQDLVAVPSIIGSLQTVLVHLISTASHPPDLSLLPRILYIRFESSQRQFNYFVWPLGPKTRRRSAVRLKRAQFLDAANLDAGLFWNHVRQSPQPLSFVGDLMPPTHTRQCAAGDNARCSCFGPHMILVHLMAHYMKAVDVRVRLAPANNIDYYSTEPYRSDLAAQRQLRDGYLPCGPPTRKDANRSSIGNDSIALRVVSQHWMDSASLGDEDIMLIVPRRRHPNSKCGAELRTLTKRVQIFGVWLLIVAVISAVRLADGGHRRNVALVALNTWAQSIGMSNGRMLVTHSASQRIMVGMLAVFAILAASYFSGEMFQSMLSCEPPAQIASVDEFYLQTKLPLYLPIETFPRFVG